MVAYSYSGSAGLPCGLSRSASTATSALLWNALARAASRWGRLEMDVDIGNASQWNADATSPQLTWTVGLSPSPKSHDLTSARSRETIRPLRRMRVPDAIASIMVLAVPRDMLAPSER